MNGDDRILLASFFTVLIVALTVSLSAQSSGSGQNSTIAVPGNALNATLNQTTQYPVSLFVESGLPVNALWSVTYGTLTNSSTTNIVSFLNLQGNFTFEVPLQDLNGTIYIPDKSSGQMRAGNTTSVHFHASTTSLFIETGLPENAQWNATYGALSNSSATNTVSFSDMQGNFTFSVPSQTVNGILYSPDRPAGQMSAGNTTSIHFSVSITQPTTSVNTTSTSSISTTTSTSSTSTVPANSLTVSSKYHQLNYSGGMAHGAFLANKGYTQIRLNSSVLSGVAMDLNTNSIAVNITMTNLTHIPNTYAASANPVYQFIQINGSVGGTGANIDQYLSGVIYNFSVPVSWVQTEGISNSSIRLLKYYPSTQTWSTLPTSYDGSNATYDFYSASSNSFSLYAVSYSSFNNVGLTAAVSASTTGAFTTNFFVASGMCVSRSATGVPTNTVSFTVDKSAEASGNYYLNTSVIGHATTATGTLTFATGRSYNTSIAAIGANVIYTANTVNGNFYYSAGHTAASTTESLTFPVATSGSFVIIMYSIGGSLWSATPTTSAPGNSLLQDPKEGTRAESTIIVVNSLIAGTAYTASAKTGSSALAAGTYAIAAYVFPPYTVTLIDSPTTGFMDTNGIWQSSSNTIAAIGTATINAIVPSGYSFSGWTASNSNVIISGSSANTFLTIKGIGTVTATSTVIPPVANPNPPLVSNIVMDVGQFTTLNTLLSSGAGPPYTGNWFWFSPNVTISGSYPNTIIANILSGGLPNSVLTVNAFTSNYIVMSFNTINYGLTILGTNTVYGKWTFNGFYADSAGTKLALLTNSLKINPQLFSTSFYANSPTIAQGATQMLTANIIGGTSPYTFNYLVYNSIGTLVANALYTGLSPAPALSNTPLLISTQNYIIPPSGSPSSVFAKDGYYYLFLSNTIANSIYYASSTNDITWITEGAVPDSAMGNGGAGSLNGANGGSYGVGYDGSTIYIAYDVGGTWSTSSAATAINVITATPSSGTLAFGTPVQFLPASAGDGGYVQGGFDFANVSGSAPGSMYLGFEAFNTLAGSFYNYVYQTSNGGSAWTPSASWSQGAGAAADFSMTQLKQVPGTSNMIFIFGSYPASTLDYRLYSGGSWATSNTAFAVKAASVEFYEYEMSAVSANGGVYLAYQPDWEGYPVNVLFFNGATSTWGSTTTVNSSKEICPTIGAINGQELGLLYVNYTNPRYTFMQTMPFSSGIWSTVTNTVIGVGAGEISPQYNPTSTEVLFQMSGSYKQPTTGSNAFTYPVSIPSSVVSNTFTFPLQSVWSTGNFIANIIVEDSATTNAFVYNSLTFTVPAAGVSSCIFSENAPSFSFGSPIAGHNTPTYIALNVLNTGNVNSNIIIYGGNWLSTSTTANFFVANTLWNPTPSSSSLIGNPLTSSLVDTTIVAPSGSNGVIYFGVNVPKYTPAQTYNQLVTISSFC